MFDERRLSFGQVAELYDQTRPSYPAELVADVIEYAGAGGSPALEVGAGTGKATELFVDRGVEVIALEPSAPMAALAQRRCPGVVIEPADFERWDSQGRRFRLVFSAQAWHWIKPDVRYRLARAALLDGGALAAFWNVVRWESLPYRDELVAAYRASAPDLEPDPGPMHPIGGTPPRRWGDWGTEIAQADGLTDAQCRHYDWQQRYSTDEYLALLRTHSDHALLPRVQLEDLLARLREILDAHGGAFVLPYSTRLCLARAV